MRKELNSNMKNTENKKNKTRILKEAPEPKGRDGYQLDPDVEDLL